MKRKDIAIAITVGLLATASIALTLSKWADPINATVVDAETGHPIQGVVVVADWRLKGGFEGGNPVGHLALMEAVTDEAGRFYIPGWGPRLYISILREWEPQLLFFKNGYRYLHMVNETNGRRKGWKANSSVDGTRVELKEFRGTPKEYLKDLGFLVSDMDSVLFWIPKDCDWKKTPKMIQALYKQGEWFAAQGLEGQFNSPYWHLVSNEENYQKLGCGSTKEFLRGITK